MLQKTDDAGERLKSHQGPLSAFTLTVGLQVLLLASILVFSALGRQQTSRIVAFDAAATHIHIDFEKVSMTLQGMYDELASPEPSKPYIEMLQANLDTELAHLEKCLSVLSVAHDDGRLSLEAVDAEAQALLDFIEPKLNAFSKRAQSFASGDFEALRTRYSRPSLIDLAAARTGLVRQSLQQLADKARQRQSASIDRFYQFIKVTIGLSVLLLVLSWLSIIRPALVRQKMAVLREIEFSDDLARKNIALRQAECQARVLYEEAKLGMRARTEFLAVVSHELRTPLNAVIGLSEIMKDEMFGKHAVPTYREYSSDIHKSGKHLLGVVSDILEFSRYESQKVVLASERVTIASLLEVARVLIGDKAEKSAVRLDFTDRSQAGDALLIDQRLVSQALVNLMDNAIKFSSRGNSVEIDAGYAPGGEFVFSVTDNGVGIEKDAIMKLLEPFEQVESAFSRQAGGLGLGLAIANKIMQSHDGQIDIESAPGRGSRFSLRFPATLVVRAHDRNTPLRGTEYEGAA